MRFQLSASGQACTGTRYTMQLRTQLQKCMLVSSQESRFQSMRAVDYSMPSLIDVIRVRKVVDVLFSKASSSRKEKWFRHNFLNFSVKFESRRGLADERSRPLLLREEGCNELRRTSKGTTIDCRPTSFLRREIVMHTKT